MKDICLKYDDKVLLNKVNETFDRGYIYIITGDSGCGKTTLLNVLSGTTEADSGVVIFDKQILNQNSIHVFRNRIGIMLQNSFLINELTLIENLDFSNITDKELTSKLLKEMNMQDRINIKAGALSVGERQRASLIRVLSSKPDIIFADEPTAALDLKNAELINRYLQAFVEEEKKTVFMVTHKSDVEFEFQKKIKLEEGKIIELKNSKRVIELRVETGNEEGQKI